MPKRIIDAHVHLDDEDLASSPTPYKDFVDSGVVGVVAHSSYHKGLPLERPKNLPFGLAYCAALTDKVKLNELEKAIKEGRFQCLKVYLGYIQKYAYDSFYRPFYKIAEKYKIPVVFHTGDTYSKTAKIKYADPMTIDEVAVDFPKVKFLIAHLGNPWFASAAEVVYKNDNVYCDTSGLLLGDLSQSKPESIEEMIVKPVKWFYLYVENPKKILFGTDWSLTKEQPYLEAIKKAIPPKDWEAVFYTNAKELFNIQEKK